MKNRYKVCYITTLPVTLKTFILKSAQYNISKGGWDVTFICDDTPGFKDQLPIEIGYIPTRIKRGISLSGFKTTYDLYRIFKKEKYDLVQYSTSNAGCYASIAAKLAGVPIRLYCQWGLDYPAFKGIKKFFFSMIEHVICWCSTNVQPDSFGNLAIAMNDHLYDERKGMVIGSGSAAGVDFDRFDICKKPAWRKEFKNKYALKEKDVVIGYVGRLLRDKGINELLTVMKNIVHENEDVKLLIVGDTTAEGIDKDLLHWARNSQNVIFSGFTTEVEKYYSAMDVFVLPSYHEGFGVSVIEAEAMGLPVVVTDIPGPREGAQINVTGLFVPVGDVKKLQESINRLIYDTSLRSEMGRQGYEYVRCKFDQKVLFEKIFDNRNELLRSV